MSQRQDRLIGHTSFYDEGRDAELHNRMTVEIGPDRCSLTVGAARNDGAGTTLKSGDRSVVRHYHRTLAAMRRECRRREVRPVAKPTTKYSQNIPAVCPECGNTRWVEDAEHGWRECPRCGG